MIINKVKIQAYEQTHSQTGANERRSVYTGSFNCPKKPLHLKVFKQLSITKVAWRDEYGNPNWGETKTTFTVIGEDVKFHNLEALITYYNSPDKFKPIELNGHTFRVSDDGAIVVNGGQRNVIRNCSGAKSVSLNGRIYIIARLVAKVYLPAPKSPNMVVEFRDGNKDNTHYSNLYYTTWKSGRKRSISEKKKQQVREDVSAGMSMNKAAKKHKINRESVRRIVNNNQHKNKR